jgi:2-methylcitrate dehydratase PrpD
MTETSLTRQLAEWIVGARYDDIPEVGVHRVKERVLDSFAVQLGGMSVSTGQVIGGWVRSQGARADSSVVGGGFKTSMSLAALVNATTGHALEYDDVGGGGGSHPASPMTAATLAVGEKVGASGRSMILAWMVGWEVTVQTSRPVTGGGRNMLLDNGWFNQGFQSALGTAAATATLLGLDVTQTRMALGNAAAAMSGVMKNRASDTKSFIAGNAAMHGVMAAELVEAGFTANEDILDGEDGILHMLARGVGDPMAVLDGLGTWDMARSGSTIKFYASCAAGHWAQDAMQRLLVRRPTDPTEIESITVHQPGFLMDSLPFRLPQTGLQGKYSLEYDVVAVALDGRAGMHEYTDEKVQRPLAQDLMRRVTFVPSEAGGGRPALEARVVVLLKNGETLEETVAEHRGRQTNPLSEAELIAKFDECAAGLLTDVQRKEVVDLCWQLDALDDVRPLGDAVRGNGT